MKKHWIAIIGISAVVLSVALTGMSFAESGQNEVRNGTIKIGSQSEAEYPAMAKITLDQAIQTALGSAKGRVLKAELENENGFLVYGVEVATPDKTVVDVKLDAGSGKLLAMGQDKADQDHHEGGGSEKEEQNEQDGED